MALLEGTTMQEIRYSAQEKCDLSNPVEIMSPTLDKQRVPLEKHAFYKVFRISRPTPHSF